MSSHTFSIELLPDPLLRRIVLLSGVAAACAGLLMICLMPLNWHWRAAAGLIWLLHSAFELKRRIDGQRRCRALRLEPDGSLQIVTPEDCCIAATMTTGSIVFSRLAWLRCKTVDGRFHVELLRGEMSENEHWRRFQVVWRHLGAGP